MAYLSVCIPTHEMGGLGHIFLKESFEKLAEQTFTDFDVIISDHSENDHIQNLCKAYSNRLTISYYRNTDQRGKSSPNINSCMRHATGTLLKILFLDDFLYAPNALKTTVEEFDLLNDSWLVSACEHSHDGKRFYRPFYPRYSQHIYLGNNTISSPSVLTIKNEGHLEFDDSLVWLMDVEYYKRCYDRFGLPKIVNTITVVNRTGTHQGVGGYRSNKKATNRLKWQEYLQVLQRYEYGIHYWYYLIFGYAKHIVKSL